MTELMSNLAEDSKFSNNEVENTLTSSDILEDSQISGDELPEPANDNSPIIPEDPDALALFIKDTQTKKAEFDNELSPKAFHQKEENSKTNAIDWLESQLAIGLYLHTLPTSQGLKPKRRKELEAQGVVFRNTVAKEYNIDGNKLRYILELDQDCVDDAIAEAEKTGDIATRTRALALKKQRIRRKNKGEFEANPIYSDLPPNDEILKQIKKDGIGYTVLCANIGIGETYLEELGFNAKVAFELEKDRCEFYSKRFPNTEVINGDLFNQEDFDKAVAKHKEHNCKLVMASPVCRPFSQMGGNDLTKKEAKLFYQVVKFVEEVQPYWAMIENVPGFLSSVIPDMTDIITDKAILANLDKYKTIGEYIQKSLENMGYEVNIADDQNAADYGTPQTRRRAIILASKTGTWEFPKKNEFRIPLIEAIGHLPSIEIGEDSGIKHHHMLNVSYPVEMIDALATIGSGQSKKTIYTNKKGEKKSVTVFRKNAGLVCGAITGDSSGLGAHTKNGHYGKPKADGFFTDARPLSIRELLIVIGLDPDMDIPQELIENDDNLRETLGEAFAPHHVKALCQMLPYKVDSDEE